MLIRCKLKATHPAMLPYSHGWQLYVTTLHDLCVFQYSIAAAIITSNGGQVSARKTFYHNQIISVPKNPKTWKRHAWTEIIYVQPGVSLCLFRFWTNPWSSWFAIFHEQIFETTSTSTTIHCYPLLSTAIHYIPLLSHPWYPSKMLMGSSIRYLLGTWHRRSRRVPPRQPQRPRRRVSHVGSSLEGGALHGGGACFQVQTVHGHHLRAWIYMAWQGFHDDES
jgi:hypothetical protein